MKKKEPIWTKRCNDGRSCAYVNNKELLEYQKTHKRGLTTKIIEKFRDYSLTSFVPDEHDICDSCLEAKYKLESRYDNCDQIGLGPEYYEKESILKILHYVDKLRKAIEIHRSQKADDRCTEDDDRLYESLGDGIKCDRRVGDKKAMLKNCERFINNRCESGGWPTYAELEARIKELESKLDNEYSKPC